MFMSAATARTVRRLAFGGALLVVTVLSLSDTAVPLLKGPVRQAVLIAAGLGHRAENFLSIDLHPVVDAVRQLPFDNDTIGHFVAWFAIGTLAAWTVRRWWHRLLIGPALIIGSGLIEIGQATLSWTRSAERSDFTANGFGVVFGLLCGAALLAVGQAAWRLFEKTSPTTKGFDLPGAS